MCACVHVRVYICAYELCVYFVCVWAVCVDCGSVWPVYEGVWGNISEYRTVGVCLDSGCVYVRAVYGYVCVDWVV